MRPSRETLGRLTCEEQDACKSRDLDRPWNPLLAIHAMSGVTCRFLQKRRTWLL